MAGWYRLIDNISSPTTINVCEKVNGMARNKHVRLYPGQKYALPDDTLFLASLQKAKVSKRKTPELETYLKNAGIEYTEKACKSCAGRSIKLSYSIIEVGEDDG